MVLILIFMLLEMYSVDCRIHCLDKMATAWTPLGYSCPVNCNNVISAINRLKMIDYEKIIRPDTSYENAVDSIEQYIDHMTRLKEVENRGSILLNSTHAREFIEDALDKIETAKKIRRRSHKGNCFKFYKMADKRGLRECVSLKTGYDVDETIAIISETLRKYTHTNVTVDITKKLMLKMLGKENLMAGKYDIKAVVKFLGHAFHAYEDIKKNNMIIQLHSRHCLTTHVSGCFCQSGYVEKSGRCIKPSDCYTGSMYDKYMTRIIIM